MDIVAFGDAQFHAVQDQSADLFEKGGSLFSGKRRAVGDEVAPALDRVDVSCCSRREYAFWIVLGLMESSIARERTEGI